MATIPARADGTVERIYRSYENRQRTELPRGYLGASRLGDPCDRRLWLEFRMAIATQSFSGRMLRLFDTGHREEPRIVADLRAIGCEVIDVDTSTGEQFRFKAVFGHVGGGMDAAIHKLPEAPATWHVGEFKTHNAKSFAHLIANGVASSKPMHAAQMQLYMRWSRMTRACYIAKNKDTDELYMERLSYDEEAASRLEQRAERIVFAPHPPERISEKPDWYQCKLCPAADLCHGSAMPAVNCRTCMHATPEKDGDGRWSCALHKRDLSRAGQLDGCADHVYLPNLMPREFKPVDASPGENWVEYEVGGGKVRNGSAPAMKSVELQKAGINVSVMEPLRQQFAGEYVKPADDPSLVSVSAPELAAAVSMDKWLQQKLTTRTPKGSHDEYRRSAPRGRN